NPRRMTVWLHEERSSVAPYGAADQRTMFTPDRIASENARQTNPWAQAARRDDQNLHTVRQSEPESSHTRCIRPGIRCIAPISTAKAYGPISRLPSPLHACALRRF